MNLPQLTGRAAPVLHQAHRAGVGPAGHLQPLQGGEQPGAVGLRAFLAAAHARTQFHHRPKAGLARCQPLQPQCAVAQPLCVGQRPQAIQGCVAAGVQAVQVGLGGKVHLVGIHHLGHAVGIHPQRAQLAVAPQLLVQQRLLLFDHAGLQQQCPDLARRADVADAPGLAQHAGLVGIAQVRQHAVAQVDAFADVQRQLALLAVEHVHAGAGGQVGNGLAQVLGIFVQRAVGKFGVDPGLAGHGGPERAAVQPFTGWPPETACPGSGTPSGGCRWSPAPDRGRAGRPASAPGC